MVGTSNEWVPEIAINGLLGPAAQECQRQLGLISPPRPSLLELASRWHLGSTAAGENREKQRPMAAIGMIWVEIADSPDQLRPQLLDDFGDFEEA